MSDLIKDAEPVVELLLQADESQLYEQLGMRVSAISIDISQAGSFEPSVTYDQSLMGPKEDIQELGRRLFDRWHKEIYGLVCGTTVADQADRQQLLEAFGFGEVAIASTLTALLITQLGLAPAIAAVIATLVTKKFFRPAYEEFCGVWSKYFSTTS